MNILLDHQAFSMQKFGGISRYYYELVKNIDAVNNNIYISSGINQNYYIGLLNNKIRNYGVSCKYFPPKTNRFFKFVNGIGTTIVSKAINYQIFHETYYGMFRTNYNYKSKNVLTVYDMIHELYPRYVNDSSIASYAKKRSINRADLIIAISQSTKNDLINLLDIDENKIIVTPLGGDINSTNEKVLNIDYPYILYVGGRSGYKNFGLLIDVIRNSIFIRNNFKVICFGGGNFTDVENYIMRKYNLANHFIHVSGDDDLLSALYKSASCLCHTSLYEGFGFPPLEAITLGTRAVVYKSSSMPEVSGNFATYFDKPDTDALTNAITSAINLGKLDKNDLNWKKHIYKYSWKNCAESTIKAYQSIL